MEKVVKLPDLLENNDLPKLNLEMVSLLIFL